MPKRFRRSKKTEYFDYSKIKFPLYLRHRKPGDKMKPLGMKQYKRLQDIFIDDKISKKKRDSVPILIDAKNRIIWACGVRMSEDFKVTPRTKKCLRISIN